MSERRRALIASAIAFVLMLALSFWLVEVGTVRRAERVVREADQSGILRRFDVLVPPSVPDAENFWARRSGRRSGPISRNRPTRPVRAQYSTTSFRPAAGSARR